MTDKVLKTTFLLRRGTAAKWEESNPVLAYGEPGYEKDTGKLKIGDGETAWSDLAYIGGEDFVLEGFEDAEVGQIAVKGENGLAWKDEIVPMTKAEISTLINKAFYDANKGVSEPADLQKAMMVTGAVKLANDIALGSGKLTVPADAEVVLDLAGHSVTSTANGAITVNGGNLIIRGEGTIKSTNRAIIASNGGTVTLEGGLIKSTGSNGLGAVGEGSTIIVNGGAVEAQEYGANATDGATIEINGGTIEAFDNCGVGGNGSPYVDKNGNITTKQADAVREQLPVNVIINGGEIISKIQSNGYVANGIYMPNDSTLTMNGGVIKAIGGAGIVMRAGKAILNGGKIITSAHPTLERGKVGDSRVVVPCAPIVYDVEANYPKKDTLALTVGSEMEFEKPEGIAKLVTIPDDLEDNNILLPANWDNE